jgi:hypothetical protein
MKMKIRDSFFCQQCVRKIFKQAADERVAESIATSKEQLSVPRMTPDGSEILYVSTPKSANPESSAFIRPCGTEDVRGWFFRRFP